MIDGPHRVLQSGLPGQQDFNRLPVKLVNRRQKHVARHARHDLIADNQPDAMPLPDQFAVHGQPFFRAFRVFKFAEILKMLL